MEVLLLLALAGGIFTFFYYAARAAFKADSRQRKDTERLFNEIVSHLRGDKSHD